MLADDQKIIKEFDKVKKFNELCGSRRGINIIISPNGLLIANPVFLLFIYTL